MTESQLTILQYSWIILTVIIGGMILWHYPTAKLIRLPQPPRHRLSLIEIFGALLIMLAAQTLPASISAKAHPTLYYLSFAGSQAILAGALLGLLHWRFCGGLGVLFQWRSKRYMGQVGVLFFLANGLTWLTLALTQLVCQAMGVEPQKHQFLQALDDSIDWKTLTAIIISPAVFSPLAEELLFRGLIQGVIIRSLAKPSNLIPQPKVNLPTQETTITQRHQYQGIALTAALFAMFHQDWQHWPALFVLAVMLGYAYQKTRSLLTPILMHALFNTTMVTLNLVISSGA